MENKELLSKMNSTINLLLEECNNTKDSLLVEVTATFINAVVNYQVNNK
ncbi:hypothetical protein [Carnobacterium divergens]